MAKIRLGALAGAVSGSIGSYTFSHNRGGPYIRLRNVADKYSTQPYKDAHTRLALCSSQWAQLTDADRQAWTGWASANPKLDSLGEKRPLTGHQAYVEIATRLNIAGVALPTSPPALGAPVALTTLTLTADTGTGSVEVAFTPTPIGTNQSLWLTASYQPSPTRNFVKKDMRLITVSTADEATGWDIQSALEDRIGTLPVGQDLVIEVAVFSRLTGLLSLSKTARATITHT